MRDTTIPLLISMGRFHTAKRFDILIEAFALLLQRMQARLWIIGKGYLKDAMEADIRKRALQNAVTLIDFCQNPYSLLRQADCFILTSDYEGMPNALIEAMSLGVPVVATDCPYGPAQLIDHGVNGYLTPRGSPSEIALWAENLLVNPDRKAMGMHGAEKAVRMFEVSTQMKKWEHLFLNHARII
jgi:glycosyltransferase involved in cell wall biosynthesis